MPTASIGKEPHFMSKRPTILIVDDEPFNVDYLEQELDDLEYDTISAANGQQALEQDLRCATCVYIAARSATTPVASGGVISCCRRPTSSWHEVGFCTEGHKVGSVQGDLPCTDTNSSCRDVGFATARV